MISMFLQLKGMALQIRLKLMTHKIAFVKLCIKTSNFWNDEVKCITEVVSIAISFLVYTNIFGLLHKEKVEFMIYTLQPS